MRDLTEKVAWVTGAGTGIGRAGALALAEEGMHLVLSGRRESPLQELAAVIQSMGATATVERLDVANADDVSGVVGRIEERFGRCDVAVLSAGLNLKDRSWASTGVKEWDTVIKANLDGAFYCCQAILPMMRKQQDGLIIAVSSWAGRNTSPLAGVAYSVSKHGFNSLVESMNMEECVNGIRACSLCPGEVNTPILKQRPVPLTEEQLAQMLQPEDLGETIRFLAKMPKHVCINDLLISPTWNRGYVGTRKPGGA